MKTGIVRLYDELGSLADKLEEARQLLGEIARVGNSGHGGHWCTEECSQCNVINKITKFLEEE